MVSKFAASLACLASFSVVASHAAASDVWVDPIGGDNANGGTGPGDAWRTVTFALDQLGSTPGSSTDRVHMLPGIYTGPFNGGDETLPLVLRDGVLLVGEGPRELVIVQGRTEIGFAQDPTDWDTGFENLTLLGPNTLITLQALGTGAPVRRATAQGVRFRSSARAIDARWESASAATSGVRVLGCEFEDCIQAVRALATDDSAATVEIQDSEFRVGSSSTGNVFLRSAAGGTLEAEIQRTLFFSTQDLVYSVNLSQPNLGDSRLVMTDCALVSPCLATFGITLQGQATIERCTFAGHDVSMLANDGGPYIVRDCLFGDNYVDLQQDFTADVTISNSIIDDQVWSGVNGNVALQPDFVDRFSGDYRLRYDSPGIDALPALTGLDVLGRPRTLDGVLDAAAVRDYGAYEFATLTGPAAVQLGAPFVLELAGDAGELARLFVSRNPLPAPAATIFGEGWLWAGTQVALGDFLTAGSDRIAIPLVAPSQPSLAGLTLGYQALQRSAAAPLDTAWSAPVFILLK